MLLLLRTILFVLLASVSALQLCAQESQESLPDGSQPDRIVDGRPKLYSFKRAIHPLTWVEVAVKPVLRSAENGKLHELMISKPDTDKTRGVKFGIGGDGTGSGIGPLVTLFHRDVLGRGI